MRSSLIYSIGLHLVITVIAMQWVSFREVKYIPRQVYQVNLVTPAPVEAKPAPQETRKEEPEPAEVEPVQEKEPEVNPRPRPKPKKPDKPKQREVPKTELEKKPEPLDPDNPQETPPAETGQVQLDTDDFPFGYYINRIRRKIAAQWRVPQGSQGEERLCRVYFRIYRDGRVTAVGVEESSGLFMFDQAAERAVLQATPMPPLPREYKDEYLGVHFSFAYREN